MLKGSLGTLTPLSSLPHVTVHLKDKIHVSHPLPAETRLLIALEMFNFLMKSWLLLVDRLVKTNLPSGGDNESEETT